MLRVRSFKTYHEKMYQAMLDKVSLFDKVPRNDIMMMMMKIKNGDGDHHHY